MISIGFQIPYNDLVFYIKNVNLVRDNKGEKILSLFNLKSFPEKRVFRYFCRIYLKNSKKLYSFSFCFYSLITSFSVVEDDLVIILAFGYNFCGEWRETEWGLVYTPIASVITPWVPSKLGAQVYIFRILKNSLLLEITRTY